MISRKHKFSATQNLLLALMFLAPALLMIGKGPALPTSDFLWRWLSFIYIPAHMTPRIQYLLFVPLGAVLVVFFRLTLGIRLLGPFRSILIAVAFQMTGIATGLLFLAAIIAMMVALRPGIKALRLPYYARVSIMLSAICLIMVSAMFLCGWLGIRALEGVAYFPIVVICLTAEGFAQTLVKEGIGSALWRGSMTALVAALIASLSSVGAMASLFTKYPELLLAHVGAIMVIAQYFNLRLLQKFNPPPKKPKRAKKAKAVPPDQENATLAESLDEAEERTGIL